MVSKKCSIYETRPKSCQKFQCAWTQNLFSDSMKPTISNVLISIETDSAGKKFLKVIEMAETIGFEVYYEINEFCQTNDTYYVKVPFNEKS